ncbi:MAG: zinc ribbon domain-containing protein [Candidatus Hydrothermarchaeaceae archaeon]
MNTKVYMDCDNCGSDVAENWEYCPFCGSSLKRGLAPQFPSFTGLEDLLTDIDEEFRRMKDAFRSAWLDKKDFEPIKGGGISVRISSKEGRDPKIDVHTFGDYEGPAPKIEERLGIEKTRVPPKITREPKTLIEKKEGKLILRAEVPGVTSEEDIDIKRMTESIEIRAYAKDMAYFTLFCIPPNSKILSKRLENEELVIEVGNLQ